MALLKLRAEHHLIAATPQMTLETNHDEPVVVSCARDALERLMSARDLTLLKAADREALLGSLIGALSAVQDEISAASVKFATPDPEPSKAEASIENTRIAAPAPAAPSGPSSNKMAATLQRLCDIHGVDAAARRDLPATDPGELPTTMNRFGKLAGDDGMDIEGDDFIRDQMMKDLKVLKETMGSLTDEQESMMSALQFEMSLHDDE